MIAMAGKSIEGLTWLKAQKMKRYVLSIIAISSHDIQNALENKPSPG